MKKYIMTALLACGSFSVNAIETPDIPQVTVQSGAFKSEILAHRQAAKVSLLGVPSTVVETKDGAGNTVRVVRSQGMTQKEAERLVHRLDKENIHAMLIELD